MDGAKASIDNVGRAFVMSTYEARSDPTGQASGIDGLYRFADQRGCQKECTADARCKTYVAGSLKFTARMNRRIQGTYPVGCFLLYTDCVNYKSWDKGVPILKTNRIMADEWTVEGWFGLDNGQFRLDKAPGDASVPNWKYTWVRLLPGMIVRKKSAMHTEFGTQSVGWMVYDTKAVASSIHEKSLFKSWDTQRTIGALNAIVMAAAPTVTNLIDLWPGERG